MDVVGVRFKNVGKIYYFSSNNLDLNYKDKVIVESSDGYELAENKITQSDNR